MNPKPNALTHPNIPQPLHGVNPRSIKGDLWWEEVREITFHDQEQCCKACGIHKSDAKYYKRLEAHEVYDINYDIGEVKFVNVIGLCHSCHRFIHSGLLKIHYDTKKIPKKMYEDIMLRGFALLKLYNLTPNVYTEMDWLFHKESISNKQLRESLSPKQIKLFDKMNESKAKVKWSDWYLLFEGKKYYSKFKDIDEYKRYYINK